MILFSWTLTPTQIACLRSIRNFEIAEKNKCLLYPLFEGIQNHFGSTKFLMREGMVRHYQVKEKSSRAGKKGLTWTWETTEKGRLFLRLVEIEIEDQQRTLNCINENIKELKSA